MLPNLLNAFIINPAYEYRVKSNSEGALVKLSFDV